MTARISTCHSAEHMKRLHWLQVPTNSPTVALTSWTPSALFMPMPRRSKSAGQQRRALKITMGAEYQAWLILHICNHRHARQHAIGLQKDYSQTTGKRFLSCKRHGNEGKELTCFSYECAETFSYLLRSSALSAWHSFVDCPVPFSLCSSFSWGA